MGNLIPFYRKDGSRHDAAVVFDPEGVVLESHQREDMEFLYPSEEIVGKHLMTFCEPLTARAYLECLQEAWESEKVVRKYKMVEREKRRRLYKLTIVPCRARGIVLMYFDLIIDFESDRKEGRKYGN